MFLWNGQRITHSQGIELDLEEDQALILGKIEEAVAALELLQGSISELESRDAL